MQGVQAAAELGVTKLIIETDALMVRQAVKTNEYELDGAGGLVRELKDALQLNFVDYDVIFSPRECKL